MKLVVDLQGAQSASRWRGIGRYSLALAENLAKIRNDHEIVIVLSDAFPETLVPLRETFEPLIGANNIKVWTSPSPGRWEIGESDVRRKRAEILFCAFLSSLEPDLILVSSLFEGHGDDAVTCVKTLDLGVPVAVILYDLIPLHDPDRYLKPSPTWERLYREKLEALSRADLLLTISEFTAADAVKQLGPSDWKIVNISAACSNIFRPSQMSPRERELLRSRLGIDRSYIVTSGTIEPHKNLSTLFSAYAQLPEELRNTHRLVLVGHVLESQRAVYRDMLSAAGLSPNSLIVTGYVTDDQLVALYSDARLMVLPSMDEGFGLPALEAMSCGTPALGANASSIPEVIGLPAAQFSPKDIIGLTQLITRALRDEDFRDALHANAKERAGLFSWEKTARTALKAMEDFVCAGKYRRRRSLDSYLSSCIDALVDTSPSASERAEIAQALAFNFPEQNRKPHLFVDVSELRLRDVHTGCQRVTRSVLHAWLQSPPEGYIVMPVYATSDRLGYFYAHEYLAKLTGEPVIGSGGPIDYASGDIFFGLDLHPIIVASQKLYLETMRRRGVRVRFLVYDLLPIKMPQYFPDRTKPAYEAFFETLLLSDGIVGISRATVDAFRAWQLDRGHVTEGRFGYDYVHLGADLESSLPTTGLPMDAQKVLEKLAERPSFLTVGTVEPRKGNAQVLDAFELLWARGTDVNLVFVGKEGWNVEHLVRRLQQHPEKGKRLFWLTAASDEYLTKIYAATTCLIAASEGEGFGLPLIEAAQAGLPILARDIDVFREVAGKHASYFVADKPEDMARAVADWIRAWHAGRAPTSNGIRWQTWAKCAQELGEIISSVPRSNDLEFVVTERVKGFTPAQKRILVSKLDHMGDLLLAIPALSRLRSRYPAARIDLLCGSWNEEQARQLGFFNTIYTYDFFKQSSSIAPGLREKEVKQLQKRIGSCDIVIDLRRQPDSRFIIAGIVAPVRVGYQTGVAEIDDCITIALPHWNDIQFETTPLNRIHITKQMLALVDAIPSELNDFIRLPSLANDIPNERKASIAIFPKAGNAVKEWGDSRFLELAKSLANVDEIDAVNVYFVSEAEAAAAGFKDAGKICIHTQLKFEALQKSVAQNSVCIANNSFGAHIASYLGLEVIGIYGGHETSTEWAPFFGENTVLRRPTPCSPCHLAGPEDCAHGLRCLDIPVELVYRQALRAIENVQSKARYAAH
ncbi:glycosyltransferase [Agrobacterium tumefaciens]|uniref:glycosyltransferase n=1 Tax=Agrobacterium tumefaciens TaxID=358 RepID=UPI0011F2BFC1|nr:glycosyltransferase [Agrobacterium tumefaciens]KAA1232902.1 glycosyltransferase [Agrobacterium tumefaciens]